MKYQNIKNYIIKYKIPIIIVACLILNITVFINYMIKINTPRPAFKEIKPQVNYTKSIKLAYNKQIKVENINPSVVSDKTVYLTFDDGPSYLTEQILDILKEENVPATFFVTGRQIDKYTDVIQRMQAENHTIGLHTSTHNYSNVYSSDENYFNDLNDIRQKVFKITGVKSRIIRLPGGSSNTISKKYNQGIITRITDKLTQKSFYYFDWNIDSEDASGKLTKECIYQNVTNRLHSGTNIILMHDLSTKSTTKDALKSIIDYAKANGYTFAKITKNTPQIHHHINN